MATDTAQIPRPTPRDLTVPRTVRVQPELWHDAGEVAASEGLSISEVVRHYLQHYVDTAPTSRAGASGAG